MSQSNQYVVFGGVAVPVGSGTTAAGQNTVTAVNGLNSNLATFGPTTSRIVGPSAAYSIGGISCISSPVNGQSIDFWETTGNPITIVNEDASSTAANRIRTLSGVNYPLPPFAKCRAVYDGTLSRWVLVSPEYPLVINAKDYQATGNGTTDDTTALQNAINAFEALASSNSAAELFIPAGTYLISSPLVITGLNGAKIRGAGIGQTIIKEKPVTLQGKLGMIVLTNCRYTTVSDMSFTAAPDFDTLNGGISAGATSATISLVWAEPIVGQRVAIVSTDFTLCDVVTIASAVGTAITFNPPVVNNYSSGAYVAMGVLAAVTSYSDQTLASPQTPSGNRFERLQVSNVSGLTAMSGIAVTCKGGPPVRITGNITAGNTSFVVENAGLMYVGESVPIFDSAFQELESVTIQSISGTTVNITGSFAHNHTSNAFAGCPNDVNNDEHIISDCTFTNTVVAGLYLEGQNALHEKIRHCGTGGITHSSVWAQYGGSFDAVGLANSVAGWAYTLGGLQQHPCTVMGGAEEGSFGLLYIPSSRLCENPYVRFIGLDHKYIGGVGVTLINVTASTAALEFHGCRLDGSTWTIHDTGGGAFLSLHGSQLTAAGGLGVAMTLNDVTMFETGCSHFASPIMTLSGGSSVSFLNRFLNGTNVSSTGLSSPIGFYGATPVSQASRVGQLTDNTGGTASSTLASVPGSYSQTEVANALASLAAQINALELIIHNLGLSA